MFEYLLKNIYLELLYRFVLWASFSFFVRAVASLADESGGGYFVAAISSPPSAFYWNVLVGTGLILLVVALFAKDLCISFDGPGFMHHVIYELSVLFGRVSSDLILAGYGMAAFLTGWGLFAVVQSYLGGNHNSFAEALPALTAFMGFSVFIGALSIVARTPPHSLLLGWWYWIPKPVRYGVYIFAVSAIAVLLWMRPAAYRV